eukprot:164992-Chlamydomonas_euryale.AAC.6
MFTSTWVTLFPFPPPHPPQRGAYKAGVPATHTGKIKYPECKKGVWPPSDWDPRVAERSATTPDVRLTLEFVYGYDGMQVWTRG